VEKAVGISEFVCLPNLSEPYLFWQLSDTRYCKIKSRRRKESSLWNMYVDNSDSRYRSVIMHTYERKHSQIEFT
jgi:hypothetical protein